jgi:hypothetical protein
MTIIIDFLLKILLFFERFLYDLNSKNTKIQDYLKIHKPFLVIKKQIGKYIKKTEIRGGKLITHYYKIDEIVLIKHWNDKKIIHVKGKLASYIEIKKKDIPLTYNIKENFSISVCQGSICNIWNQYSEICSDEFFYRLDNFKAMESYESTAPPNEHSWHILELSEKADIEY